MNRSTELVPLRPFFNISMEPQDESVEEYIYILPAIVIFGLSGNIISLITIFHSRLRHVNANVYLIVLTSADSVFLAGLMLVCLKVDWISYSYCLGLEYVLMTASYVSSWATAFLTIERYLAIAHPLRHVRYSHVDRVRVVMYWLPIPFLLQFWQFISLVPNLDGDMRACRLKEANYQIIAQAVDTLLCYIIPCSVIVILNTLIVFKIKKSAASFGCEQLAAKASLTSRRQGGNSYQTGTWTRILWVMPMVFLMLNTPFYVIMMIEVISQVIYDKDADLMDRSQLFVVIYNSAHYLYYMNAAIDVLVYAFSSANFRKTAVIAWKRILCPGSMKKFDSKSCLKAPVQYMLDRVRSAFTTDQLTASRYSFRPSANVSRRESRAYRESPGVGRSPSSRSHLPLVESPRKLKQIATTTV